MHQLFAIEHRQTLAGIEYKGNICVFELLRMLQHSVASIRRNNAKLDICALFDFGFVRLHHCARMKRGDLVVVFVRHDHGLRGVGV
jgi:hypothetical protein